MQVIFVISAEEFLIGFLEADGYIRRRNCILENSQFFISLIYEAFITSPKLWLLCVFFDDDSGNCLLISSFLMGGKNLKKTRFSPWSRFPLFFVYCIVTIATELRSWLYIAAWIPHSWRVLHCSRKLQEVMVKHPLYMLIYKKI